MLIPAQAIGEPLFLGPLGIPHGTTQPLPLLIRTNRDIYPAVLTPAPIATTRGRPREAIAWAGLNTLIHGVVHDRLTQMGYGGFSLCHIDELPLPGSIPVM